MLVVGALLAPLLVAPTAQEPAPTPPLGWNSWNTFGCDISEAKIRETADAVVSSGMRDAGYEYVVIDDCWFDPERDASGALRGSADRFPGGMKAMGDYLHERGLKFGIYEVPTARTCAQRGNAHPGSPAARGTRRRTRGRSPRGASTT